MQKAIQHPQPDPHQPRCPHPSKGSEIRAKINNALQTQANTKDRRIPNPHPPPSKQSIFFMTIHNSPETTADFNLPNLIASNKALRASWVGKIMGNSELAFAKIFKTKMRVELRDLAKMNFGKAWVTTRKIPQFYKEMLMWFRESIPLNEPRTGKEVRKQLIWNNASIRVQGKSVFCRALYNEGVKLIDDFLDDSGRILDYRNFRQRFPAARIGPLRYMGWCQAIPAQWRSKAAGSHSLSPTERVVTPTLEIKGRDILVQRVRTKYFYTKWINAITPTSQIKWENEGINFDEDWSKIYQLPFKITNFTRLQNLQYRITHRFFTTRRFLCIRNVISDPFCNECGEIETTEHFFAECHSVSDFWNRLMGRLNNRLNLRHQFNVETKKHCIWTDRNQEYC